MFPPTMITIFCLGWFVVPCYSDEPPKYKPIDPEIIAAYEKLGAKYGSFEIDDLGTLKFSREKEMAKQRLPGFYLFSLDDGMLLKLPPVPVPFGLETFAQLTDEELKELKHLKNLAALDLHSTKVTDAGLKELKDLTNLTSLDLDCTQITDAGLKELKDLKNLTGLNLRGTKVTDAGLKELKEALPKCKIIK